MVDPGGISATPVKRVKRARAGACAGAPPTIKGSAEITPIFETVSCRACHYVISKLCQGMCHHYGA